MRAQCISAVQAAIGRPLKAGEARKIEQRIQDAMKREAIKDPAAWAALTTADRLRLAATTAAKELTDEATLKRVRVARQIQRWDAIEQYTIDQVATGRDETRLDALERVLAPLNDGKNHIDSVEYIAKGIEADMMRQLVDAWEAIAPRFLGLFGNKAAEDAFVLEAHGTPTGSPVMAKAAKAWHDVAEILRQRYNAAGGYVGRLDNWGLPHSWSDRLTLKAGPKAFADDLMRWIDRSKYVHEDGRLFNDVEMRDFLSRAWETITTNGANKDKPSQPGGRVKANRHGEHRQIHFKDGQSALEALSKYSDRNLFEVLSGHVHRMARDIALIEQLGPNSDHAFARMLDRLYQEAAQPGKVAQADSKAARLKALYASIAGNGPPPLDNWLARGANDFRALMSAAKLGSATITAIGDLATLYQTAHVNNLPLMRLFLNQLRALNPLDRTEEALARRAGLMVATMQNDVMRFAADAMGPRWSNKLSAFFFRANALNAWTEASRRSFGVMMMDTIGNLTRSVADPNQLDPSDWKFLRGKGIDQQTWDIWRAATPEKFGGNHTVLTPESIYNAPGFTALQKQKAASKLLAITLEEQNIAVIEPGARERVWLNDLQRGTVKGELLRTIWLFKSFPQAMISRHVMRALKAYPNATGKAGYLASLITLTTLFGAVAMEINDILSGRDPRSLNPTNKFGARNWLAAFLKGGALGIYGDFLFSNTTGYGRSLAEILGGPGVSTIAEIDSATRGNLMQAAAGEETHAGADMVRALKGITPGANLWYAKLAFDHLIWQDLQELFSPGYNAKMRAKAHKQFGTTWWIPPGQATFQHPAGRVTAPDLSQIVEK